VRRQKAMEEKEKSRDAGSYGGEYKDCGPENTMCHFFCCECMRIFGAAAMKQP